MAKNELTPSNTPNEYKPANIKHSHQKRNYNSFETLRFGELTPFFYDELVPNDKRVSLGANVNVRSLNLKSPLMQDLSMSCRYFVVPYQCILPFNWERIFSNPTIGTDIPKDANCLFNPSLLNMFVGHSYATGTVAVWFKDMLLELYINELVCSPSGLSGIFKLPLKDITTRKSDLGKPLTVSSSNSGFNTALYQAMSVGEITLTAPDDFTFYVTGNKYITQSNIVIRLIDFISSHPNFTVKVVNGAATEVVDFGTNYFASGRVVLSFPNMLFNMGLIYSYQLVCAHFYSNDFVDFVYSADLFKLAIQSIYNSAGVIPPTYDYNGVQVQYDILSYKYVLKFFEKISGNPSTNSGYAFQWLASIFRFNRSLKFEDYFVSLKTRPLAVGSPSANTTINPAEDGSVDVVDISRGIQIQRFLNQVNRVGRKFEEFTKGIFGVQPAYDYHDPKHIGSFTINVTSPETDNTGTSQLTEANSTTSNFRGGTNSKRFEFDCDRFSYIIGIANFDLSRSYIDNVTPLCRRYDRFDFFNPYMQYIGDEAIPYTDYDMRGYLEKVSITSIDDLNKVIPFGYGVRHYPYKVRVNEAMESFRDFLPSWVFLDDKLQFEEFRKSASKLPSISADFIRCKSSELDDYFVSLTGTSLTTYFHFICSFFNVCEIDRPMVTAPQIIG